jgi:c(7)-type cytochrome triheme protein
VPPDFASKGKDSEVVTFSHEKHMKEGLKCTSCHVKVFKMKKGGTGPLTMEKMKAGEQCGAAITGRPRLAARSPSPSTTRPTARSV